jgi:hypothetical protein
MSADGEKPEDMMGMEAAMEEDAPLVPAADKAASEQ